MAKWARGAEVNPPPLADSAGDEVPLPSSTEDESSSEEMSLLSPIVQLVTLRAAALSLAGEGHQASLQLPHEVTQSNASSSAVAVANPSGQALMCAAVLATSVPLIEVRDEEMDGKAASLSVYGEPSTYIHTFCRHTVYLSLVCIYLMHHATQENQVVQRPRGSEY